MSITDKYRRDGTPYPDGETGLLEWAKDIGNFKNKIVRQQRVGRFFVSTVWLGLDHSFCPHYGVPCLCPPLIFETMVFDQRAKRVCTAFWEPFKKYESAPDVYQDRYSTEAEAIEGHKKVCAQFKKKPKKLKIK